MQHRFCYAPSLLHSRRRLAVTSEPSWPFPSADAGGDSGRIYQLTNVPGSPFAGGTAEQYIKEGKNALKWTRLSCRTFAANAVRLQLRALAYNLANFMRTLALPKTAEPWSLTSLREKLIKIGAKVTSHGRYVTFQLAEVAVPRQMFAAILSLIARLRAPPALA
jgi:hypothetical protein